ncbi:MAG: hypothetical protein IJF74_03135 [Clostridia bacterium]|nr:hypothetical protein [Clostridia bacterium]
MADTEMRLLALQRSIEELYDNQVRQRRMLADLLYNLDEENMPGVKALIERYKAEDGEAIAALKVSSDQNFAAIESLAAVQSDQQESIAGVKQTASALESEIESLASVQTEQGKNIAGVSQRADDIEAEIESLASVQTEQGKNIAGVSQRADNIEAEIESLVSVQTEHGKSIASIEQNATELGAEVVLAVEKASSAESAASAAESAASSAESKASAAETAASSAESKASAAQNTANTAKTTADTAKTTADSAKTTANAAESTANAAETTANAAKSTADDAIGKVSDGAYIIARVNETSSSVKINTDKLNLSGYATSASVEQTADELGARIESLASVQTEQGENITSVTQRADDIEAEIESLVSVQTEHGKSIASIEQNATELGAEVVLAVEKASSAESAASAAETAASSAESKASSAENTANAAKTTADTAKTTADSAKTTANAAESTANAAESTANAAESTANAAESTANTAKSTADDAIGKVSDGAYIIARVNEDGSLVKIKADKLELSGYATFLSLKTAGATEIDGANLKTGTVSTDRIALNENGQIDFTNLGRLAFSDESTGAQGEIYLQANEYGKGEILINADGTIGLSAGKGEILIVSDTAGRSRANVSSDTIDFSCTELYSNGDRGLNGTFPLGGGSITVVNGIVTSIDAPVDILPPDVITSSDTGTYDITNPNGYGTLYYYTFYRDNSDGNWYSDTRSTSSDSVSGYLDLPDSGGTAGVVAWVEYNGVQSDTVTSEIDWA